MRPYVISVGHFQDIPRAELCFVKVQPRTQKGIHCLSPKPKVDNPHTEQEIHFPFVRTHSLACCSLEIDSLVEAAK